MWAKDELRPIQLGEYRRRNNSKSQHIVYSGYNVPAAYHLIVCQLVAEDMHGMINNSHESHRRQAYAKATLDAFGAELKAFKSSKAPPHTFRSKTLTPILQRQRVGLHDAYTPYVSAGINKQKDKLSIEDVTRFYLKIDPTDPKYIPSYRHNLLYCPDARWYLGFLINGSKSSPEQTINHHRLVRDNHNTIIKSLPVDEDHRELDSQGIPLLSHSEVRCIVSEKLESFFMDELHQVVSEASLVGLHYLITCFNSLKNMRA